LKIKFEHKENKQSSLFSIAIHIFSHQLSWDYYLEEVDNFVQFTLLLLKTICSRRSLKFKESKYAVDYLLDN